MGLARAGYHGLRRIDRGPVADVAGLLVRRQECLDGHTEFRPTFAGLFQETGTFLGRSG